MRSQLILPSLIAVTNAIVLPPSAPHVDETAILLTTSSAPTHDSPACLRNSYYGAYGSVQQPDHVFITTEECVLAQQEIFANGFESGNIALLREETKERVLVWVGEAGVVRETASDLAVTDSVYERILANLDWLSELETPENDLVSEKEQHAFTAPRKASSQVTLYHQSRHSLILGVAPQTLGIIDRIVPGHLSLVTLPAQAYPLSFAGQSYGPPVPEHLIQNLVNITASLKYSADVDQVLDALDYREIVRSVRWLTGESGSGIVSRHSFSPGSRVAAKWIKGTFPRHHFDSSTHTHPLQRKSKQLAQNAPSAPSFPASLPTSSATTPPRNPPMARSPSSLRTTTRAEALDDGALLEQTMMRQARPISWLSRRRSRMPT